MLMLLLTTYLEESDLSMKVGKISRREGSTIQNKNMHKYSWLKLDYSVNNSEKTMERVRDL
ncbi:hypothetical protein J2Z40_002041 [Cytobacillus eiseniae]|uniref:Uncharacterized protein n=1 Tax=Cytobacillus eiseniae TaxID=762947 RepID=A0ABS4RFF3_9BACI|nr:hypothetical protein [Cytobacillus eiseniae]